MRFSNEYELQEHVYGWLIANGVSAQREVKCGKFGRCDIVTEKSAIEIKPVLSRSAIDNASAQVAAYAQCLGKIPVIAGEIPDSPETWQAAQVAVERAKLAGISIFDTTTGTFIYQHFPSGLPVVVRQDAAARPSLLQRVVGQAVFVLLVGVLGFNILQAIAVKYSEPLPATAPTFVEPINPAPVEPPSAKSCQPWEYCELD
jgi:hypothetical protein